MYFSLQFSEVWNIILSKDAEILWMQMLFGYLCVCVLFFFIMANTWLRFATCLTMYILETGNSCIKLSKRSTNSSISEARDNKSLLHFEYRIKIYMHFFPHLKCSFSYYSCKTFLELIYFLLQFCCYTALALKITSFIIWNLSIKLVKEFTELVLGLLAAIHALWSETTLPQIFFHLWIKTSIDFILFQ